MCNCKNIDIGSYDNSKSVKKPFGRENFVDIDRCIFDEVMELWALGIETTGCCCGHNKITAYIGVTDEFIPQMKEMGYEVHFNPCRPSDEDSFTPKSI